MDIETKQKYQGHFLSNICWSPTASISKWIFHHKSWAANILRKNFFGLKTKMQYWFYEPQITQAAHINNTTTEAYISLRANLIAH